MNVGDLVWIFFMLTTLQPVMKQRFLESARLRLIARIERSRKSRVILLVHRQETMSLLGFPLMRYIDINDSEEVMRACELTDPEVPLDIVLHTPAGSFSPPFRSPAPCASTRAASRSSSLITPCPAAR